MPSKNQNRQSPWRALPWGLVSLRLFLGPILLLDAADGATGLGFAIGLVLALLSDIADGMLASRLGVRTQLLRRADSLVDFIFLVFIAAAAWLAHRAILLEHGPLLFTALALLLLSQIPALLRFGRTASFHAYSAKAAGLALVAAAVELFGFQRAGLLLDLALWVAILSHLDRIAISLLLPAWQTDVPGAWAAWRQRYSR